MIGPHLETPGELIGRDDVLARVEAGISSGASLFTVVGPPGIGKTRLALEIAQGQPDPVVVHAGDAHDLETLEAAIADGFGAPPMASPTLATLRALLLSRAGSVVVIDDIDRVASLLRETLRGVRGISLVVTARGALGAAGAGAEQVVELGPLSTDRSEGPSDAARLLLAAHLRLSGRSVAPELLEEVERLAESAEGVPLALELAAGALARVGPRAAEEVLPRLIAESVRADSPAARALNRSWDMLAPAAQELLACVSVLHAPFDARLAAALDAKRRPIAEVIGVLADLRAGSLLRASARHPDALEVSHVVRELALARAPAELVNGARRRAIEHFIVDDPEPGAPPRDASVVSLARHFAREEPELAARALARIRLDARSLGTQAEVLACPDLPLALRADLSRQRSWAFFVSGRSAAALEAAAEAIEASDRAARPDLVAAGAINAVSFAIDSGRIDLAPAFLERARTLATDERAKLAVQTSEAYLVDQSGDSARAMAILEPLGSPLQKSELYRLIPATIATMRAYDAAARGDIAHALHSSRVAAAASSVEGRPLPRYRLVEAIFMHAAGAPGAEVLMRGVIADLLVGEPRWAAAGLGHLAALEATRGQLERSTTTLSRALALGSGMDSRAIRAALDWSSAVVEAAGSSGPIRPFRAPSPALWSRVLEAIFPMVLSHRPRSAPPPPRSVLTVDLEGAYFVTGMGETVHLGRRHSLRRLLAAVAAARAQRGSWVSTPDALAAAWPEDRSRPASLRNRLRVAVATLRKLGIGDALEGNRLGYRLDPSLEVEIVNAGA